MSSCVSVVTSAGAYGTGIISAVTEVPVVSQSFLRSASTQYRQGRIQEYSLEGAIWRARAYNGGLGAVPPAGSRGRAPGQGGRSPPEAERFWCCHMSEMALNCYVYELFMVINGSCSTNMYARQLSFNFSSMVWGAWPRGPPFGSAPVQRVWAW